MAEIDKRLKKLTDDYMKLSEDNKLHVAAIINALAYASQLADEKSPSKTSSSFDESEVMA